MSNLPVLASTYATSLAIGSALLARASRRPGAIDWPRSELPRFRRGLARTLVVLAGFIVVAVVVRHHTGVSLACLGVAALAIAGSAYSMLRSD